jgi:heptosyltransferase-2
MSGNLLVRLHSLGDVVLASGTAVEMQRTGPVSFVTGFAYKPIVNRIPGNVEPLSVSGGWKELRRISSGFSTIVDLQNNFTTKLAFTGRSVKRFQFDRRLRHRILHGAGGSLPWRALEYLRTWSDTGSPPPVLERYEGPSDRCFTAGIVVGGRWPLKTMPVGVVAELARLFCDVKGADVVLIGNESDIPAAQYVVEQCGYRSVKSAAGEGDISRLINRIETLDLLISPDSGPAHLAMALGVPVQVVFTSTSPALGFWPEGFRGSFMVESVPCRPCHRHGGKKCDAGDQKCRKMLVPRAVFEEAMCLVP